MEQFPSDATEVLIVGAGPTGLMMACQLAVQKVSFRIIDKNTTSLQNSGALIVQARTLEIFDQLGIASEAISQGIIADRIEILHNDKVIAGTSIIDIGRNLTQFPFLLMLEQSETEKLLLKFLAGHGFYVERNVQFRRFAEDKNRITTGVIMPDGSPRIIVSKYLIAADGSKSTVRDFLNIPFTGKSYARPIYILDCGALPKISPGTVSFAFSEKSFTGFFPLRNKRWRVDGSFPGRVKNSNTQTLEMIAKGFQEWNNMNFNVHDTEWFSVSYSQHKYARTIRIGNCFLAGDSAHVNTPVGAQGMNTGLQDAHNLAWKLAFVLKHMSNPELLDSYSTERLGISKGFARYADAIFRVVTNTNLIVRIFRTFALKIYFKTVFPRFDNKEKSRMKFFKTISQIDIHYKPALGLYKDLEKLFLRGTPKPGYRFPYVDFVYNNKNTNSHQILNATGFTLLVFAEELTTEIISITEKYNLTSVLLKHLTETDIIYKRLGITNTGYYLIRPDMFIGLRSASLETRILNRYLEHSDLKNHTEDI